MNKYPRVLLISNTALRRDNSNGNLLLNHLSTLPKENLASFYIQDAYPDVGSAGTYFRFTDKEKAKSFFSGKNNGFAFIDKDIPISKEQGPILVGKHKSIKESAIGHILRERVWKSGKWDRTLLYDWIKEFNPTVILVMVGRSSFILNLTYDIAEQFNIPIVVFTTEDEYFHKYPFYKIFKNHLQRKLKKSYKHMFSKVKRVIAHHDKLNKLFKDEFNKETITIYPSTNYKVADKFIDNKDGDIVYVGNIQPNRVYSLKIIADTLYSIDQTQKIHLYCGDINKQSLKLIKKMNNVIIHDPLPKKDIELVLRKAKLVLHFESFRKKDKVLIENSFSGKLIDILTIGRPLLVFAPTYTPYDEILKRNENAFFYESNPSKLKKIFLLCLYSNVARNSSFDNALKLLKKIVLKNRRMLISVIGME